MNAYVLELTINYLEKPKDFFFEVKGVYSSMDAALKAARKINLYEMHTDESGNGKWCFQCINYQGGNIIYSQITEFTVDETKE